MTIVNSVIIGSGSGDEVEAYALGDAKNAVKDDKVNLNHSANVLSSEEDISVVVDGLTNIRHGYITKDCASFVGRYSWSSYTYLTTFKKVGGVWEEIHTQENNLGNLVAKSPYGLFFAYSNAWKVVDGVLAPLEYLPTARTYEPKKAVQMSATGEYCAFATYTDNAYKVVVYYKNKPLKVLTEWSKTSQTYAECFFVRKNGVDYLFLNGGIPYSGTKNNYAYRLSPTGVEYLGVFTTTANTSAIYHYYVGSVGDNDSVIFTTSNDDHTYLDSLSVLRADIDFSAKTCKLLPLAEEKSSFISLLRDTYGVGSSDTLIFEPTGVANVTQPLYNVVVTFDEGTREFKPFLSKATLGSRIYYNAEDKLLFELKDYSVKFSLYSTLLPFEQRYVASQPSTGTYYKDQTITGIVKENNNGILKVSTVEDPNNPPPAVPDEGGLKTTINYGSAGGDFGSVSVGYGYFRNTLTKPSDKYVSYNGGTLTEDNISGRKATTMNIILGRKADMGSWTSDTEGYLTAQDSVVLGVNKKLSTPVYLWHDLSYITPAVPETLEPEIVTGGNDYIVVGSPVISSGIASGFSADNYITASAAVGSTNNATYKARFRVDAIGVKGPIMHYEGLFGLNIDESGNLYDWSWGNSAAVNICATTAGHTYTASVNINGTTRSWTVTDETTGETFTNSLTDSRTIADSSIVLTYGRSSSPTATTYFNGTIYLGGCSASIGGTVVWAAITSGTISLPVSWKNIDGVLYEYPNGFPKTQASVLLDDNAVREGSNNLYVTRTGDICGLVISTSPFGADSYAIIGTVELDANGSIIRYTSDNTLPAPTKIYINNIDVSDKVEVVRLPDGSGYAAKVPNAVTYRRYEVDSHSSDAAYWGVGIDPSNIRMERIGEEVSFSEPSVASPYLYVVNSDSLNGVRRPYEGGLHISDNNYAPAA